MKYIYTILSLFLIVACLSCNDDFLDKAPGVDRTEDDIFKSENQLEVFVNTIYGYAMPSMFMYRERIRLSTTYDISAVDWNVFYSSMTRCDEADESSYDYQSGSRWNTSTVSAESMSSIGDDKYFTRWISLRQINIMLKRIDEVPDASATYKNQIVGEMHVLRAINYLEMVKRYGGVPIVDYIFEPGVKIEKPRDTFEECMKFIVKECNLAIANPNLPATYPATQTGRVTKTAAYALKAKALLYAASPLFNTDSPYLNAGNDNKLICYGNYDANRWVLAEDATKEALDYALANGYGLIDLPENRDPQDVPGSGKLGPVGNYRYAWETNNNKEIILAYHGPKQAQWKRPMNNLTPFVYDGWGNSISVPLNFYRKYEKKDGTPQIWELAGGEDLLAKYAELDPRFKQTLNYTLSYYDNAFPISEIFNGGAHYKYCSGGVWMRKYYPRNGHSGSNHILNDPIFRVNELYLNYAEAINEASGPTIEAYKAVNTIRNRSGMPNFPSGLSKEQFREKLRNERAIELAYDDQRFYDIRRWMIAEQDGVMQGDFYGLEINKLANGKFSWKPYVFETRSFLKRMYMLPFPHTEVLKGDLIQNPGYIN